MGHAAHFLRRIERLSSTHADLALGLYRDPELVQFILDHARLPGDFERVAIALEERPDTPWLIVTRDGKFVTCLAAGMQVTSCARLSRSQIDHLCETRSDIRETYRRMREGGRGEIRRLMYALMHGGSHLTREDFHTLSILFPLTLRRTLLSIIEAGLAAERFRERYARGRYHRLSRAARDELSQYWKQSWMVCHGLAICAHYTDDLDRWLAVPDQDDACVELIHPLVRTCARSMSLALTLRALHVAACVGPRLIARCKQSMYEAEDITDIYTNTFALGAIGLRHGSARTEIQEILLEFAAHLDELRLTEAACSILQACLEPILRCLHPDAPIDDLRELFRSTGASMVSSAALSGCFEDPTLQAIEPEAVPAEVAAAWPLVGDSELHCTSDRLAGVAYMLPWVATASTEELYLPASQSSYFPPLNNEILLGMLDYHNALRGDNTPLRAAPTPGRNESCPCGSGKKYKRCCGAG